MHFNDVTDPPLLTDSAAGTANSPNLNSIPLMKTGFLSLIAMAGSLAGASAAVTLTFDSTTDGFTARPEALAVVQSSVNGGSLQISAVGGYKADVAQLNLRTSGAFWTEMQQASQYGGVLTFQVTVLQSEQVLAANPNWFEVIVTSNSTNSGSGGTGGYNAEVFTLGLGGGQWPLAGGTHTTNVSVPISSSPSALAGGDKVLYFDTVSPGWTELRVGLNNDPAGVTQGRTIMTN